MASAPAEALVLCAGAVTLDTVVLADRLPADDERVAATQVVTACGGPAATTAVTLARLGIPVALVARVGRDAAGSAVLDALESAGVSTGLLIRDRDGATATSVILLEAGSASRRIITSQPGDGLPAAALAVVPARSAWVHVDHAGWPAVAPLARQPAHARTWRLSVDGGNPIAGLELAGVDLYAPTLRMLRDRYPGRSDEDAVLCALADGAAAVAATDGAQGALAAAWPAAGTGNRDHRAARVPAFAVTPVSTLGAGDVFHGGVLAGLVQGLGLLDAVRMGNAAAALSCRSLDGQSGIPHLREVEDLLSRSDRNPCP